MQATAPTAEGTRARRVRAAVLFADLAGFTPLSERDGVERAYSIVTGGLRLLDDVARRHGGAVDKYLGDRLMAVFGHPVPLPDPCGAVLRAALEMRERVAHYASELGVEKALGLSVGINAGPMVAGPVGGRVAREFHVFGDTVNVAARIGGHAPPGSIYVGESLGDEKGERFEFRALGPLSLKGKAQPVPVLELLGGGAAGERGEDLPATPFIGRDAELARLRLRLARAAAGAGGVVAVVGEAGIGKSRLLAELRASPEAAGLRWLTADAPDGAREEDRARPRAVVADDLQWAETTTLRRLEALLPLARERPLLVLLSLRAERPGRAAPLLEAVRAAGAEILELGPLPPEAAGLLVRAAPAGSEVSPRALSLLVERARGNPARLLLGGFLAEALDSEGKRVETAAERSGETERRRSTVLFADLAGFTALSERMEPEQAYPLIVGCLELLDETARRHGGTVDKHLGDCVLALFGVPRAMEDAPRAAVNAAIEMREGLRRYAAERGLADRLDLHAGIHTGLGISGEVTGPLVREFALMGGPVDVASDLLDAAEAGEILVGPETHRYTEAEFEYRARAPLPPRAGRPALPVFEVLSRRPRLHRARPGAERRVFAELVGREAELRTLGEALEGLRQGRGAAVSLVAEAGLGKTRLVAELRAREEQGLAWREGRSRSTGGQLGYHAFADLGRSWAGIADEDDEATARAKLESGVERLLPAQAGEVLPFLERLLGLRRAGEREARLGIEGADHRLLRAAVTRVLRADSRVQPVVVVMEDLHWADQSSIELLESLLRLCREEAILFLNAFRPGFPASSGRVRDLARRELAERHLEIELAPLEPAAARQLVKRLFREGEIPVETRKAIEEKARGNPFFIEEVVRSLVDQGAVEQRDGRFLATQRIHEVVIPGTVQEVVMARVDGLRLRQKQLLEVASVVGPSVSTHVLARFREDREELERDLAALRAAEFLVSEPLHPADLAFAHPLIQEVTYAGLVRERREELHRAVGEAIAAAAPGDLPGRDAMLAYHFGQGRDLARAEQHLFRAGHEATRAAASSEALRFFRQASRLYLELHADGGDADKRALLEKNVGMALFNRGQLLDAIDHFDHSLGALVGWRRARNPLEESLRFAANLALVLPGLYLRALRGGRRPASLREREAFDVMFRRALSETTAAPMRFAVDTVSTLRHLFRVDSRSVPEAGGMLAGAVGVFSYAGVSFSVARRILALAREVVQAGGTRDLYLYYRLMEFVHHFLEGDWSDAHCIEADLLEAGIAEGRLWEVVTYLNLEGVRRLHRGEYARAREHIERLEEIAELYQHDLAASAAQAMRAYLHVERREFDAALAALERYHDEHPEPLFRLSALTHRAKVEALRGRVADAAKTMERAEAVRAEAGRLIPYHGSSYAVARYLVDLAELERRGSAPGRDERRRLRGSRAGARRAARKVALRRPEVARLAGREAWLEGRPRAALGWWERALASADALGGRPERARLLAEVARHLAGEGGRHRWLGRTPGQCRAEARRLFEELGLAFDLEQLEGGGT
jgi:class 3 adenylate cyclase